MKYFYYGFVLLASLCMLQVTCVNPTNVGSAPEPLDVQNVMAKYDIGRNQVRITWDKLDVSQFSYYQVFRASDSSELPDVSNLKWEATELRSKISKDSSGFWDILGLPNTKYYYGVRAAVEMWNGETYYTRFGNMKLASLDTVRVGAEVGFNINNGDLFTANDHVKLIVIDPDTGIVQSVRFTNISKTFLINKATGKNIQVNFNDPTNPPDTATIRQLLVGGFIKNMSSSALEANVEMIEVPDFDLPDTLNPIKSLNPFVKNVQFLWRLKHGNGDKRVFIERTYKLGLTKTTDTVADDIKIAPYRIQMSLRNKIGGLDGTMRKDVSATTNYYVNKPRAEFSVSIYADTTMSSEFTYWMGFGDSSAQPLALSAGPSMIETRPRKGYLTGFGPSHDDNHVYVYSIDTISSDKDSGFYFISQLLKTTEYGPNSPYKANGLDPLFKLRGPISSLNETAIPGSYFGQSPKRYRPAGAYVELQKKVVFSNASEAYRRVTQISKPDRYNSGFKPFVLFARFKGLKFGDTRMCVIGADFQQQDPIQKNVLTNFDLYPPAAFFPAGSNQDANFLTNGSAPITGPFTYSLSSSGSIQDKGKGNVTSIELLVAKADDAIVKQWTYGSTVDSIINTGDTISLNSLLMQRHQTFPYTIKVKSAVIAGVSWNIDPSSWPSGKYLMAIIAEDQFGNRGFAPIQPVKPFSNPWLVTVQTGK